MLRIHSDADCFLSLAAASMFAMYTYSAMRFVLGLVLVLPLLLPQLPQSTPQPKASNARPQQNAKPKEKVAPAPPAQPTANPTNQECAHIAARNQPEIVRVESVKRDWFDITTLVFSVLLVVVGIFGAGIALYTLAEIKKEVEHANIIAGAARDAANAALLNARAVIDSERAWLLPAILVEPRNLLEVAHDNYPNSIEIAVRFRNVGRTPAWVTGWYCTTLVTSNERVTPFDYGEGHSSLNQGEAMAAGSRENLYADFAVTELSTIADIRRGRSYLYVYGFLTYRDVFNQTHHTYFSRRYSRRQTAPGATEEGWMVIGPQGANSNTTEQQNPN